MSEKLFEQGLPHDLELQSIAREFLTAIMMEMPCMAKDLGIHRFDQEMPDLSPEARQHWQDQLANWRQRLKGIDPNALDVEDYADWTMLTNQAELLWSDATDWNPMKRDPNWYNQVISESVMSLTRRQFQDPNVRAQHLAARLSKAPELLQWAKVWLDNPPPVFVEIALEQFPATVFMFEGLGSSFANIDSPRIVEIEEKSRVLIQAYADFVDFLRERWLTSASGEYRLGERRFRDRLRWQEGIDDALPTLLTRGYEELNRLRTLFFATVTQLDPEGSVSDVLARLYEETPEPSQVLDQVRGILEELKTFTEEKHLLDLPPAEHPVVVETPAYLRMTTLASLSPVGPFEEEARESYYQITLPEADAKPSEMIEQMAEFNPWTLRMISAHEVYPGHAVQFSWLPQGRSTVRKILWSGAFVEGWAHYAEELMVDSGYGQGHPLMQLAEIQEALVRVGRFIVGIRLHTGDMSLDQAKTFFRQQCVMAEPSAHREALRGTMDPFYLIYTLGKLEILRLRRRAKESWGTEFSLEIFHNRLLAHGAPTLAVLERLLFPPVEECAK